MNKPKLTAALLTGATFIAGLSVVFVGPVRAAPTPTVSRQFAVPLKAAHDDELKQKYREALAELDKAKALPKPTAYETHLINELSLYAYIKTKDYANAAKAMEGTLDDGFTDKAEVNRDLKELVIIYNQLGDYGKVVEFGNRAIASGAADADTELLVSQAYYKKGDFKNTYKFTDGVVSNQIKQGETPKEIQLQFIFNSCVKLQDEPCVSRSLEWLVTYYPKPDYWRDLMESLFQSKQAESNDLDLLNIYRLAMDVGAMTMPSQYIEMAQLALEQGSPGDAQQVLEKGYGGNVFTDQHQREHADRLLASAKKQAATDQSSLPRLATEAAAASTGQKDVAVGMAYLGYQQYDKAAEALTEGLMKGSLKNEAQAQLLLGIAQLKAGRKADAVKAFHAVTGDPTLARLAALWSLRAHGPSGSASS